jgi:hypothetical protein
LSQTSSPFCSGYFGDRISQTICLGWPWTMILLILASQVARITGISHQCWAYFFCFAVLIVWHLIMVLAWISLMATDVECVFMSSFAIYISCVAKYLFISLSIGLLSFFNAELWSLYIY